MKEGKPIPNMKSGRLKEKMVKMSPDGPAVTDKAKKAADGAKEKFIAGSFVIYKGPLKDNTGKEILAEGKSYALRVGRHGLARTLVGST